MRKYRSKSEADYTIFYRHMRMQGGSWSEENFPFGLRETQECAVLSYDYHDSHFDGWINRHRMAAFERRSRAIENWRGAIPF